MSWKAILKTTEGSEYATPAERVVQRIETQLEALDTFFKETQDVAASDPGLTSMRNDIESAYKDTLDTLAYIGRQDLDAMGHFYALGALSTVSSGLGVIVDLNDIEDGWGPVSHFYRAVNFQNDEKAQAIENQAEREAFIAAERQKWSEGRIKGETEAMKVSNAFAEAGIEFRKGQVDPSYTPDPERGFADIAGMHEEGRKSMILNPYDDIKGVGATPADYEALLLYRNFEAFDYAEVHDNPIVLLDDEMQEKFQQINMNVLARALSGEYGESISMRGFRGGRSLDVNTIDPSTAMTTFIQRSGVAFNPLFPPIGALSMGDIASNYMLPNEEYIRDYLSIDFKAETEQMPEQLSRVRELVEASGGELISTEQLYEAMGEDPSGPDYSLPPARTYARIQYTIENIEARIGVLEALVADPKGQNFQELLKQRDIMGAESIESLLLGLKDDIGDNPYGSGLAGEKFQEMYDAGHFGERFEAVLGVPLERTQTVTLENSPLLQALNNNFQTFYPPLEGVEEIPGVQDGTSQLGEALTARGGAVILDNHSQIEPLQFMMDSLPEIASTGSTKVLVENTVNLNTRQAGGGWILFNQNDPLEDYYEKCNPDILKTLKNGYTLRLERLSETRDLTPKEQESLDELQARDELFKDLIVEAYTQYGIKFEYYGGGIEGKFSDEFGTDERQDARLIASNYGWEDQIRTAKEGVDNVIIWAGGAHFIDDVAWNSGDMVLDEAMGYPTFSLSNPGGILWGAGDYNLSLGEGGHWVSSIDPVAPTMGITASGLDIELEQSTEPTRPAPFNP